MLLIIGPRQAYVACESFRSPSKPPPVNSRKIIIRNAILLSGVMIMGTTKWASDIIIVQLPGEPRTSEELHTVAEVAVNKQCYDVIIDLSKVNIIKCVTLCGFMRLRKILTDQGQRLVFCNASPLTQGTFVLYGFDQIFKLADTAELTLKPSQEPAKGGTLLLATGSKRDSFQRRNYSRFDIAKSMDVDVMIWHQQQRDQEAQIPPESYWVGKLVDVSVNGANIAIKSEQLPTFRKNEFVEVKFASMFDDDTLIFDARIRSVMPTADGNDISVGMEFAGLETNPQGMESLQKICNTVANYFEAKEVVNA